jgi:hypothetical protein
MWATAQIARIVGFYNQDAIDVEKSLSPAFREKAKKSAVLWVALLLSRKVLICISIIISEENMFFDRKANPHSKGWCCGHPPFAFITRIVIWSICVIAAPRDYYKRESLYLKTEEEWKNELLYGHEPSADRYKNSGKC